jgi:hypothetical protein
MIDRTIFGGGTVNLLEAAFAAHNPPVNGVARRRQGDTI